MVLTFPKTQNHTPLWMSLEREICLTERVSVLSDVVRDISIRFRAAHLTPDVPDGGRTHTLLVEWWSRMRTFQNCATSVVQPLFLKPARAPSIARRSGAPA